MIEGNTLDERFDEYVGGSMLNILRSLNKKFKKMSPAEKGDFIIQLFGGDDGKIHIEDVDLSLYHIDVEINGWIVNGNLSQCGHKVANNLFQDRQEVKGSLSQSLQRVSLDLMQNEQVAGGAIYQDEQKAGASVYQDPDQGKKPMTPKEKGQFLLKYFENERGDLALNHIDLSDFKGDVAISDWKVGGDLYQDHQEVGGSLYQDNQKVNCNLFQDKQEVGWCITQDEQKAKDECECVEPNYKAEYERLRKELYEADRKNETLLWALGRIKDAMSADKGGK